ncbi:aminoacyl-tRNA hydrolase [Candidatus Falkowbacteria bacterium RIFOXYC2_FULL_47_12]|uniref:Peptidyl-tRNA hydrolase n=2 Tax=Candidatus Falkowiibacteriota TaxID=1752728 RepID=A0A1F5TPG6_9BACT|nr:MAG: aminoacyl-tRNA hydrolase [Candidatus Falkowbacteria bacterium RIFOXYA2_FULL_47_9]OGF40845.1 MAG: aminoacyl-tRNA hydrolase [Candidatus Falkowbacteria bacterium RIFOXYC2_FULL_47_12]
MKFIIGLGNPGEKYKNTRHNTGFVVLDALAGALNAEAFRFEKKFNADVAQAQWRNEKILLVKPQTFMNNSGLAVRAILNFHALLPKRLGLIAHRNADLAAVLTVIHDDVDFALGTFKLQQNRSAGGHKGVQSIITHLKTQNFTRARIGIATPLLRKKIPPEKFVLDNFLPEEKKTLQKITPEIIAAILKK